MFNPAKDIERMLKAEKQGIFSEGFKTSIVLIYKSNMEELSKYGGAAQQMAINSTAQQFGIIREHVVQTLVEANIIKLPEPEKTNKPKQ